MNKCQNLLRKPKGNCYWMIGYEALKILCERERAVKENYLSIKINAIHIYTM